MFFKFTRNLAISFIANCLLLFKRFKIVKIRFFILFFHAKNGDTLWLTNRML